MTFTNIKFHLPIHFPFGKAIQVILQNVTIQWRLDIPVQSSANSRTDDLILSGRSLMKIRNRTGPKTDPCGTPDRTGTGSEARPSNTTF